MLRSALNRLIASEWFYSLSCGRERVGVRVGVSTPLPFKVYIGRMNSVSMRA